MTCPYVTQLIAQASKVLGQPDFPKVGGAKAAMSPSAPESSAAEVPESGSATATGHRVVVPGGCDAMRRLGDQLAFLYPGRVFVMHVPRSSEPRAVSLFAGELARLRSWLCTPSTGHGEERTINPPAVHYPRPPKAGGVFLIAGPVSDSSLLELIYRLGADVAGLESCTSPDRWQLLLEEGGESLPGSEVEYRELAARLLQLGMCPRRSTEERLAYLRQRLQETRASSVIYARQSFCDPGAYDALGTAELCRELDLPYLELEVDFPFDSSGPLRTRIEAFLEAQLLDESLLDDDLFANIDNNLFADTDG